jgi:hypothetical protein
MQRSLTPLISNGGLCGGAKVCVHTTARVPRQVFALNPATAYTRKRWVQL